MDKYNEYRQLNLPQIGESVQKFWEDNHCFEQSLKNREGHPDFVFYEGPPSANGMPGIHHVIARTIKDIFCRYKTLKGFNVQRKAGWDTHGLPVELGVEKNLGITKEDIGKKISVEDYNAACRKEVMKYKDRWDDLTRKMGYWVDLEHPYITFTNKYIESVWYLLKQLYQKNLLYKGYSIQPFSPAAGTGLSTHELNQPGCYRDVKDTTCVAMFRLLPNQKLPFQADVKSEDVCALAWTTTPWTLPSNTALCVGPSFDYNLVKTVNPYSGEPCTVILADALMSSFFKNPGLKFEDYKQGDKELPYQVLGTVKGTALEGLRYEQLIPWVKPTAVGGGGKTEDWNRPDDSFRFILGDYVTTEDGTGIVHIAPTFGADDARVGQKAGIGSLLMFDRDGLQLPMVDRQGRFCLLETLHPDFVKAKVNVEAYRAYEGKFVKNAYDPTKTDKDMSLDVEIVIMLKEQGKLFKSEKHTHNYPHCWRTDKPVLYYPLDSWFIRTTACKDRMIALNKTIGWKPEATGTGRFGNWLENLVDWNLSRSRYWGTPLPIWVSEDRKEQLCIGSVAELKAEIEKSIAAGFMTQNPLKAYTDGDMSEANYEKFDLHRPHVDEIVLVSPSGKKMFRESDLIDVWFDSGAMPYAQIHYPFENKEKMNHCFPADFIAEGVDQTRGWFFTLHAIASMVFDSVAYKNVVSNGLVLDKNGNKMSKRLGNAVDPFTIIGKYGPDATRWYMITNSQPWENLKFDEEGVGEVQRKFFGTLYNTYGFFALYANIDGFRYTEADLPSAKRPEIDRWILSELNTLIKGVDEALNEYEPTRAGRLIQTFVDERLSNWYVRLSRRRFWKGGQGEDKISAYQTLYTCLETLSKLIAPIAPFFAERLYNDLNAVTGRERHASVHYTDFPAYHADLVDKDLEERMQLAQKICSMVLSLRKKQNLKVRQPLQKIMLPVLDDKFRKQVESVQNLILSEVNIKEIEFITDTQFLSKKIKPDFKALGPKYGKLMKPIAAFITAMDGEKIAQLEKEGSLKTLVENQEVTIALSDVDIFTEDIPGWAVTNEGTLTVALDIALTDALREEGLAREWVNRIQNLRKDKGLEVTDKITVYIESNPESDKAVEHNYDYICSETLAVKVNLLPASQISGGVTADLTDTLNLRLDLEKAN